MRIDIKERSVTMSIVLVGGHDRMHRQYKVLSKEFGHKIKNHDTNERRNLQSV